MLGPLSLSTPNAKNMPKFPGELSSDSQSSVTKSITSKPLSLRPDVMNKNILRAIRKQCKDYFKENLKSKKKFFLNVFKCSETLLAFTNVDWQEIDGFHKDDFAQYFGLMVSPSKMKKLLTDDKDSQKLEIINDVFYKYSHRVFQSFISIPEIRIIVKIILERRSICEIIAGNPVIKVQAEEYQTRMENLLTHTD